VTKYQAFIERQREKYGDKFSEAGLRPQFIPFYNSGQRVRVRLDESLELTGTIGATGGWRPCFLLMRTSRSLGSPWILERDETVTAVKRGRKYRAAS